MSRSSEYDNPELLAALKRKPLIAWPTITLIFMAMTMIGSSWYFVLNEQMPLLVGTVINIIAYYMLFSPIHDGSHRALSSSEKLNEFFNLLAYVPMSLLASGTGFPRLGHMQHHIHTGKDDLDPDIVISSKGTNSLHRWFVWGIQYVPYFQKYGNDLPRVKFEPYRKTRFWISFAIIITVAYHYPLEALMLWLFPMLFGLNWMTAFVFSYLPHHIHKRVEGEDPLDPYQSTCNIMGYEWILSPLTQYQNYHLMHHIYPTVPFYRMEKIWKANYTEHMKHNPAIIDLRKEK